LQALRALLQQLPGLRQLRVLLQLRRLHQALRVPLGRQALRVRLLELHRALAPSSSHRLRLPSYL
jgi:hypothetical protein